MGGPQTSLRVASGGVLQLGGCGALRSRGRVVRACRDPNFTEFDVMQNQR